MLVRVLRTVVEGWFLGCTKRSIERNTNWSTKNELVTGFFIVPVIQHDSIDRIACVVLKFVHSGVKYHYNITLDDKIVI